MDVTRALLTTPPGEFPDRGGAMSRDEAFGIMYATLEQWRAYLATGKPLDADDAALLASDFGYMKRAVDRLGNGY